jgi:FtsH-binding integral membrane protein
MIQEETRYHPAAASLGVAARAEFIQKTYVHLFAAILGFIGIEVVLFQTGLAYPIAQAMLSVSWLLVLGGFVLAGWVFNGMAARADTLGKQYVALAGYVVVEALIFVPLLVIADMTAPGAIGSAAVATLFGFSGLTAVVLTTRKDFSFLGSILRFAGILALVLIVCGAIFGFQLGTFFSVAMIALAGGAILYETSNVLHHYPEDRHVSAALSLFASVALMFWYVLRLFMSRD